jgi:hypothetical protein
MLQLTKTLLSEALAATQYHGYGTFFPAPPEIDLVKQNWSEISVRLAGLDLDAYETYDSVRTFAPKSRLNVRRVALLHPFDFLIYTALALVFKRGISKSRLPADRVFSYRSEKTTKKQLYKASSWKDFRTAVQARIEASPSSFVGMTDIADFFPRIYQHRLVNALDAVTGVAQRDHLRVLEKLLFQFSDEVSYGIPVGPPASRVFAEAILIDVDSALVSEGVDFLRFVDDFVILAETPQLAEYGIRFLGETLFNNHGLTLQTAKTRVLPVAEYKERFLTLHSEKEQNRRKVLDFLGDSDYEGVSYDELDDDQKKVIDAFNLSEMLNEALAPSDSVDYQEVSFILKRLSALQKPELIPTVLGNLERLYPVADAVAAFFKEFRSLEKELRQKIGSSLLAPILNSGETKASEFYAIWALDIFRQHADWNHAEDIARIFRETSSDTIRRFAALALAVSGSRSQAVSLKGYLPMASSLSRTAILLATAKSGRDERKHWRKGLRLNDPLERLCSEASL